MGALAGVVFGAAVGCSSLLITLAFPDDGITSLRPIIWEAFVVPTVLGVVVAALGGAWMPLMHRSPRMARVLEGSLRAFVVALALAAIGVLAIAALRADAATAYGRGIRAGGPWGGVIVGHQALSLPNEALGVLVPAMGGATELVMASGDVSSLTLEGIGVGEAMRVVWPLPEVPANGTVAFPGWFAFLMIAPAAGAWLGGRRAARGARDPWRALGAGAGAGMGFAVLVWGASWLGTITIEGASGTSSLGPVLPQAAWLAVAWGSVGGSLGAAWEARQAGAGPEP